MPPAPDDDGGCSSAAGRAECGEQRLERKLHAAVAALVPVHGPEAFESLPAGGNRSLLLEHPGNALADVLHLREARARRMPADGGCGSATKQAAANVMRHSGYAAGCELDLHFHAIA